METNQQPKHCLLLKVGVVATVSKSAACNKYAGEMGVDPVEHPRNLLQIDFLDLILELTGDPAIMTELIAHKSPTTGILDRQAAMLFLDIASMSDQITERETEINLATSFASALLEASPDGVLVVDRDYRIINCNNSPLINSGIGRESLIGRFCHEVMHPSEIPCTSPERMCPARETLRTGLPSRAVHEITMADRGTQICQVTTYPIFKHVGEITHFVVTVRDMTKDLSERIEKRAQSIKENLARFVQDDRLASLGRLVASVCHEINNPITSIVTFNKLILSYARENGFDRSRMKDVERYLGLSVREAMRCGEIVKNLLTFARQKNVSAKQIDLAEIIHTVMLPVNHQLELAGINCDIELPSKPYTAWGDSAQIQQCLMNLIFNAIDAMPQGGTMTISGEIDTKDNMVWLTISDTGHGIEADELPRIFEPFYSTKTDGKGVGLGLSMVYGIIREHNGTVEVDSELGKGTTFRVKLPRLLTDEQTGGRHESVH